MARAACSAYDESDVTEGTLMWLDFHLKVFEEAR